KSGRLVRGGQETPPHKLLPPREIQQEADLAVGVIAWQPKRSACVPREGAEMVVAVADDDDRHAASAETAYDAQRAISRSEDDDTRAGDSPRGDDSRDTPRGGQGATVDAGHQWRRGILRGRMPATSRLPAKALPATKRINGPKDHAAGAPVK